MWTETVLQFLDRRVESGADINAAVAELFQSLATESRTILRGADRSSVRVAEESGALRFVALDGEPWPPEMTTGVAYINRQSTGRDAINRKKPLLIENVRSSKYDHPLLIKDVQSHISVPIFWRRHAAVLSLDSFRRSFGDADVPPLQDLVARTLTILEHLALIEDKWLLGFESFLSSSNTVVSLCQGALDHIRRLFGVRRCSIFLQYPGSSNLTLVSTTAVLNPSDPIPVYEIGEGLTGYIAETKRSLRLHDQTDIDELRKISERLAGRKHSKWHERSNESGADGLARFLGAPLLVQNTLVGVVRLTFKERDEDFSAADEASLESLASRMALAIQNIWLKEGSQKRLDRLTAFDRLGIRLAESLDLKSISHILLEEGLNILDCDSGHVRVVDRTRKGLVQAAVIGKYSEQLPEERPFGQGTSGRVAVTRKPYIIDDLVTDKRLADILVPFPVDHPLRSSIRSLASFPLIAQDELVGTLTVHSRQANAFGVDEQKALWDLANRGALAIRGALLFNEIDQTLKRHIEALERLREMGMNFVQTLDLKELLRRVLEAALKESSFTWGTLRILDERGEKWVLRAAFDAHSGPVDASLLQTEISSSLDLLLLASSRAEPTSISNAQSNALFQRFANVFEGSLHRDQLKSVGSALIIPMRLQDECLGLIFLCSSSDLPSIDDKVLGYLQVLAAEAAVAVNNGRLFAQLQRSLEDAEPLALLGAVHGGFSHQMRAGLQKLLNEISLTELAHPNSELQGRIAAMRQFVTDLQNVLRDIELFSLRGSTAIPEPVDINAAIERAVRDNRTRFSERVKCNFAIKSEEAMTLGNRVQIQQAFGLIIGNAVEAMPHGGILTIETSSGDDAVEATFTDTGIGMDKATLSRFGQPFFTTKKGGSGLGISIVKRILSRHEGALRVKTALKEGTSLTLVFPRMRG